MDVHQEPLDNDIPASENEMISSSSQDLPENLADEDRAVEAEDVIEEGGHGSEMKPKSRERNEVFPAPFLAFKALFEGQTDPEAKLQLAIDFMEISLAQGGTPHFRSFWEARRLCLPLFKESIAPPLRSNLWLKYSELSKEARRLKDLLDEQSSYAVEQIEIAVQALEKEIEQTFAADGQNFSVEALVFPQVLKDNRELYLQLQHQLNALNTQASRINALRKELLKTEMRVKHKNKFFQRLSAAGDKVFPRRKELIKDISHRFTDDVDHFIKHYFENKEVHESFFILREEIKAFQSLAKALTLNTHSFTHTRLKLSECWDRIKVEEKERKKERVQQQSLFKQNAEEIHQQIQAWKEEVEKGEGAPAELLKKGDAISAHMRKVELGREEVKVLRDALNDVRKQVQDRLKAGEEIRHQQELERDRQKKEKYNGLRQQVEKLLHHHEGIDANGLIAERDALLQNIHESPLIKSEKQELERLLKPLRDTIAEKKEQALLALSDDDRQALQQLQTVLEQRKIRRQEIKQHLEDLRKGAGSSGLDFEKAMIVTSQINEEKERLDKSNHAIHEIESKIRELQKKMR